MINLTTHSVGPKDIPKSGRRTDAEWMTQGTWNRCKFVTFSTHPLTNVIDAT